MKALSLVSLMMFGCMSTGIAQFRKGGVMITGAASFYTSNSEVPTATGFSKSSTNSSTYYFSSGYFVTNRLALGIDLTGTKQGNETEETGSFYQLWKYQSKSIQPGFFARYYLPIGQKFNFYFEGGVSGGFGKYHSLSQSGSSSSATTDVKSKGVYLRLVAGVNYFITNHFALECNVGSIYWQRGTGTDVDTNYDRVSNSLDFAMGLRSLRFGVLFFFGGREEASSE